MKYKQIELFKDIERRQALENPMARAYGEKPGYKCKSCDHLVYKQLARRYYKCELYKITSGAATDFKVNWTACSKWTMAPDPGAGPSRK